MPCHNNVLYLIANYLEANGLYASSLALQQESGVDIHWLRGRSREVALLRRWIYAGDIKRARALLLPLATLSDVSKELQTALLALDELEMAMKTLIGDNKQSRQAQAKLECFKNIVPLFRNPINKDESDVFTYVAMPQNQLLGLIDDAVQFHRQMESNMAQYCISVICSGYDRLADEKEQVASDNLLLDSFHDVGACEENQFFFKEDDRVSHSVEWTPLHNKQQNAMAQSVDFNNYLMQEIGGIIDEKEQAFYENEKETADIAVSCEIDVKKEVTDAAVSCGLDCKETVNVGVSCGLEPKEMIDVEVSCKLDFKEMFDVEVSCGLQMTETVDIAVSCEPIESNDVAIQTDHVQQSMEKDEKLVPHSNEATSGNQVQRNMTIVPEVHVNESEVGGLESKKFEKQDAQCGFNQQLGQSFDMSNKSLATDWTRNNAAPNLSLNTNQSEQNVLLPADSCPANDMWTKLHQTFDANNHGELSRSKKSPQRYDELTLDHVVCAGVIAEVKEPQAVRALDVHPSGAQLAVGTNARALRVFTLSTPLQQQQFPWLSSRGMILPLLPVSLERHKYHDSGLYCVSYNPHLTHHTNTSMLASGAADGSVKVLVLKKTDCVHNQQLNEIWVQQGDSNGEMGKTRALHFSSPHLLWTTKTTDRRLCCWDIRKTHKNLKSSPFQTLDGHVGEIQAIAMPHPLTSAATNTLLLSAALDRTVRLWDTRSRRCERLVTSEAQAAFSLHFHPIDDNLVVSGHQDGSVVLWDLRSTAREALQRVVPHQDECRSVRWSPGGQWLLSAAFDGTLCVLRASRSIMQPVASYHKHYGKVLQAQWHPIEPAFVSSGADKRVKLWAFG